MCHLILGILALGALIVTLSSIQEAQDALRIVAGALLPVVLYLLVSYIRLAERYHESLANCRVKACLTLGALFVDLSLAVSNRSRGPKVLKEEERMRRIEDACQEIKQFVWHNAPALGKEPFHVTFKVLVMFESVCDSVRSSLDNHVHDDSQKLSTEPHNRGYNTLPIGHRHLQAFGCCDAIPNVPLFLWFCTK